MRYLPTLPPPYPGERAITTPQVARLFGVDRSVVLAWVRSGRLAATWTRYGYLYQPRDIRELVARCTGQHSP
jgi:predicted site-specific integrase-resolvase